MLTSIDKPQQAWAELCTTSQTPQELQRQANVEPIYFSAIPEEVSRAAARTGLLKLVIPQGDEQSPPLLVYGPFSHELTGLSVPPAIMLGLSPQEKAGYGDTEDYFLITRDETFFKPGTDNSIHIHGPLAECFQGQRCNYTALVGHSSRGEFSNFCTANFRGVCR